MQKPKPRPYWLEVLDVVLLAAAMGVALWLVLSRRSRKWVLVLSVTCLGYFGFYREGCICSIGAIQNVALALTDAHYSIPIVVTAVFFLPLLVALFFGRAFCGGVCPLGAVQELVLLKPVQVPRRLDRALGLLKYAYLGLAIWLAVQPSVGREVRHLPLRPLRRLLPSHGLRPHALYRRGVPGVGHVRGPPLLPLPVPLRRFAGMGDPAGAGRAASASPRTRNWIAVCARKHVPMAPLRRCAWCGRNACTARGASHPVPARDRWRSSHEPGLDQSGAARGGNRRLRRGPVRVVSDHQLCDCPHPGS